MPLILNDLLHKTHSAQVCSQATLITGIVMILTLVAPIVYIIMTYSKYPHFFTHADYWLGTITYFEKPRVLHYEEFLVFIQTDTDTIAVA